MQYVYEYKLRGFSLGCQPKGFTSHNDNIGKYGTVTYDRQLTKKELFDYDLQPYKNENVQFKNNHIYYCNSDNYTMDIPEYQEVHEVLQESKNDNDIMDNDLLNELYNNHYNFYIKVINKDPYYYNHTVLCELTLLYINKPIAFYINKNNLKEVVA